MRHLSIKQKASSTVPTLSTQWESKQKANSKSCEISDDKKIQASLGRTSSDPCSKPCGTPYDLQVDSLLRDQAGLGIYKCSMTLCHNCRKTSEPLSEECQPPKANGPLVCNSMSDCCSQAELQHRLKPSTTPPDSAPTSGLVNHVGIETVKKERESTTAACTQKKRPTALTIWPHGSQHNHKNQMALQEEFMNSDEKPSYSNNSSVHSSKGSQELDSTKMGPYSPPTRGTQGSKALTIDVSLGISSLAV